jgi:hypothetical protein
MNANFVLVLNEAGGQKQNTKEKNTTYEVVLVCRVKHISSVEYLHIHQAKQISYVSLSAKHA